MQENQGMHCQMAFVTNIFPGKLLSIITVENNFHGSYKLFFGPQFWVHLLLDIFLEIVLVTDGSFLRALNPQIYLFWNISKMVLPP